MILRWDFWKTLQHNIKWPHNHLLSYFQVTNNFPNRPFSDLCAAMAPETTYHSLLLY